jgi:hypothetical protein
MLEMESRGHVRGDLRPEVKEVEEDVVSNMIVFRIKNAEHWDRADPLARSAHPMRWR